MTTKVINLNKISITALAALLILSPAYAAHKKAPPHPPAKVCVSPDAAIATAPKTFAFVAKIEGTALTAFKDKSADNTLPDSEPFPDDVDMVEVLRNDDVAIMFLFKNGCAKGFGTIGAKLLPKLLGDGI